MKLIGQRTIRGVLLPNPGSAIIQDGTEKRINVFDGRYDTGIVVTKFVAATGDQSHQDFTARLATEEDLEMGVDGYWDWGDTRQIAWCSVNGSTDLAVTDFFTLTARDNLVIEDLFFSVRTASTSISQLNYYIECDIYELMDYQGSLAVVQNKAQG